LGADVTVIIERIVAAPRSHLAFLDGLRGVAALAVFAYHLAMYNGFAGLTYAPLAVDFFFMLSGFVIALAYEDKLRKSLSIAEFIRLRFIRLYPMIFAGMALGFSITVGRSIIVGDISGLQLVQIGLSALALLPCYAVPQYMEAFPANAPMWSLFFEVVANIVYATFLAKSSNRVLYILAAVSGVGLIFTGWQFGTFLHGFDKSYLYVGLLRIGFSFPVGVILFRQRHLIPRATKYGPQIAAILALILIWPGKTTMPYLELMFVILSFPVIVAFASTVAVTAGSGFTRLCALLGTVSYPLYAIHTPFIRALGEMSDRLSISPLVTIGIEAVAVFLVTWLVIVFYDEPVRRCLAGRTTTLQLASAT
jgi:peptidoglycan/LPS O-acetylase OafA/YrhL